MIRIEHCFIIDSFHIDFWKPYVQKNNYAEFINYLNSQSEKFTVTNNIKVAGNIEYHFPIIKVGKSILEFDLLEKKEPVRCISGELNDCKFMIFAKVCPNNGDGAFLKTTGIQWAKGMENVNIIDLSQLTVYHFKLENDQIKSVSFEPIQFRN
jgi:hypothetical protein